MSVSLKRQVWKRAKGRCEYCRMPSEFYLAPYQIDHVIAEQHGGPTTLPNLALCCFHCNLKKGPNIAVSRCSLFKFKYTAGSLPVLRQRIYNAVKALPYSH